MIQAKKKICKGCKTPQFIWARGCCKSCDPGKPKRDGDKDDERKEQIALDLFFANQYRFIPANCEECDKPLNAYNNKLKRCVVAHILPKSKFKNVATHASNVMFLGVSNCSCHSKYDNGNAESRKKMKCYSIAVDRLSDFSDRLNDSEKVSAEKYLGLNFNSL